MAPTKKALHAATGFFAEFKKFAARGNVFDLAIAVVVGNAFTGIVNSLVGDIITPLLGLFTNGTTDLKNLSVALSPVLAGDGAAPLMLRYGAFLQSVFNFLVIAFSIFVMFKVTATVRQRVFERGSTPSAPARPEEVRLLEEIRDLLRQSR